MSCISYLHKGKPQPTNALEFQFCLCCLDLRLHHQPLTSRVQKHVHFLKHWLGVSLVIQHLQTKSKLARFVPPAKHNIFLLTSC